jgi:isopentenyl-diphosphate delta-isomerase
MSEEKVILVDTNDKGLLHRAFSVFILNESGELMLQQRALDKYHSPGLWTNTCCSHQREGESNVEAGKRRLFEEMGFVTELTDLVSFIYKAPFDNGLTEHEFDHVLIGYFEENPKINQEEVAAWKWMPIDAVKADLSEHPDIYTEWFKIIFDKFYENLYSQLKK